MKKMRLLTEKSVRFLIMQQKEDCCSNIYIYVHTHRNTHIPCFQTWNIQINEQLVEQNEIIGIIKNKE